MHFCGCVRVIVPDVCAHVHAFVSVDHEMAAISCCRELLQNRGDYLFT